MTLMALQVDLCRRGVELKFRRPNTIVCQSPVHVLTQDQVDRIRRHKPILIRMLEDAGTYPTEGYWHELAEHLVRAAIADPCAQRRLLELYREQAAGHQRRGVCVHDAREAAFNVLAEDIRRDTNMVIVCTGFQPLHYRIECGEAIPPT